jgi:CheY-like chemotaxis protein
VKNDLATRHIPVCVISTDDSRERALSSGAMTFVSKPIQSKDTLDTLLNDVNSYLSRDERKLVVVDHDGERRKQLVQSLAGEDVQIVEADNGADLQDLLRERTLDCLISGPEPLEIDLKLFSDGTPASPVIKSLPVIVYGKIESPLHDEASPWRRLSEVATVRHVHSMERLLDQAALFMHRSLMQLGETTRQAVADLHQSNKSLAGKRVLIVDDDMRNIFALSTVLEEHQMAISSAGNGRDAIRILQEQPDVDIVLMDIMMPGMDGFETMREIRKLSQFKNLPIIAVTAKAMKGDRERCIEAGAWDYLAKPVDAEQMLASLRAWLHR